MSPIAIALCADNTMIPALHVAAHSALMHLAPDCRPHIHVVAEGFSARDRSDLAATLGRTGRAHGLSFLDPPRGLFEGLPTLHGALAPYYRLALPRLVAAERILYLDCDIVVRCDLALLFALEMATAPLGAVVNGEMGTALDRDLRRRLGEKDTAPAFNDGVLLFNASVWRARRLTEACVAFGRAHAAGLTSHDQTILNALFAAETLSLPAHVNIDIAILRDRPAPAGVIHYVGSPKPWDLAGRLLVPHAEIWAEAAAATGFAAARRPAWRQPAAWRRLPRILGGYRRALAAARMARIDR